MSYLVDTNVISELSRGTKANPRVRAWFDDTDAQHIYLSALTLGEIRKGVEKVRRRKPKHAARLETWFHGVGTAFSSRVLPVDEAIADRWGRLSAGPTLPVVDTLIAATAIEHGLTVVTRNVADFDRTGVHTLNPWT